MRNYLCKILVAQMLTLWLSACVTAGTTPQRGDVEADNNLVDGVRRMSDVGKIYLASPGIAKRYTGASWKTFLVDPNLRYNEVVHDIVFVSDPKGMSGLDLTLVQNNVDVFSDSLSSPYLVEGGDYKISYGGDLLSAVHLSIDSCGFTFKEIPDLGAIAAVYYGVEIRGEDMCKFLGVLLAAYGYRVIPSEGGLEIRKKT